MRRRSLIFLLFLFAALVIQPTRAARQLGLLDFHEKTTRQFNQARRLIASGSLENLCRLIRTIVGAFSEEVAKMIPRMGPASNMYKMRWSREMEQVAIRLYDDKMGSGGTPETNFKDNQALNSPREYKSFVWMGNILDLIKSILSFLPGGFAEQLQDTLEMLETIIVAFWMGYCYPKHPEMYDKVNPDVSHCSAEALFADRYEIGCFSNLFVGICVVRNNRETRMFNLGVSCFKCPVGSHCEYEVTADGYYEQGDLCVAPDPNITMVAGDVNATTIAYNATMATTESLAGSLSPNLPLIVLFISCALLIKSVSQR